MVMAGIEAVQAQTNPAPFVFQTPLTTGGTYRLSNWDSTQAALSYPPNMMFQMASILDPGLDTPMTQNYQAAYNLTTQTRISGRGVDGFSFINTSTARDGGYIGAAVLSFNSSILNPNNHFLAISFKARTWIRNFRFYAVRLQARPDTMATWTDVVNLAGQPIEYVVDSLNTWTNFSTGLPSSLYGKPFAQIRWKYYAIPTVGVSGARPMIGIDDIELSATTSTSAQEIESANIQLWPNPGSGVLQFSRDVDQVEIFNVSGQLIWSEYASVGRSSFSTSLTPGTYLVKVKAGQDLKTIRYVQLP